MADKQKTVMMKILCDIIQVTSKGDSDIVDITDKVTNVIKESGIETGTITLFVVGSTASLTTMEFEPGLVHDLKVALDRIAPKDARYAHHERWGDDNGHSHVKAALLGPSLAIPFTSGKLSTGTWQQIVLIDFDTRKRDREIVAQVIGV